MIATFTHIIVAMDIVRCADSIVSSNKIKILISSDLLILHC